MIRQKPRLRVDRWKLSTAILAAAIAWVCAGRFIDSAHAQPRPMPRPVPAPHPDGGQARKGTPALRAAKLLDSAKQTLLASKQKDAQRERAIKLIDVAIGEAKQMSGGEAPADDSLPKEVP